MLMARDTNVGLAHWSTCSNRFTRWFTITSTRCWNTQTTHDPELLPATTKVMGGYVLAHVCM